MKPSNKNIELILSELKAKACTKQDVVRNTADTFGQIKLILSEIVEELNQFITEVDKRIVIEIRDKGPNEIRLKLAGDMLLFSMHSNIFNFEESHTIYQTDYVKDDEKRAYCGVIFIHNFLADSFKYNRMEDLGFLIARIFINNENHFFVEGQRQLGFLYNEFDKVEINDIYLRAIIEAAIIYSLDFELLAAPFENTKQITVHEMIKMSQQAGWKTSKRPGYKFSYEEKDQPKA
jgi:hypothetical protein